MASLRGGSRSHRVFATARELLLLAVSGLVLFTTAGADAVSVEDGVTICGFDPVAY